MISKTIKKAAKLIWACYVKICDFLAGVVIDFFLALFIAARHYWRCYRRFSIKNFLSAVIINIKYIAASECNPRRVICLFLCFFLFLSPIPYSLSPVFAATFEVVDKLSVLNSSTLGDDANDFTVVRGSITLSDSGEGVTESRLIFGISNAPSLYRPMSSPVARTLYLDNNLIIGGSGGVRVSTITFTPGLADNPSINIDGMLYYNTTEKKLRLYDNTSWKDIAFGGTISGTQNYIAKYNSAAGDTLGNSTIFDDGTNVGINTASPAGRLSVQGTGTTYTLFVSTASAGTVGNLVVNNAGNVGIGTTSPNIFGFGNTVLTIKGSSGYGGVLELATSRADENEQTIGAVGATDSNSNKSVASIWFRQDGTTAGNRGGAILFRTKADGGDSTAEAMRISQSGNVGIGTANPGDALDVRSAGDKGISIWNTVASAGAKAVLSFQVPPYGTVATISGIKVVDGNSDGNLVFSVQGTVAQGLTERMRILNSGNVGIGTTAPGATLHVSTSVAANMFQVGGGTLTVTKAGNVGIGTADPHGKFQVVGTPSERIYFAGDSVNSDTPKLSFFGVGHSAYISGPSIQAIGTSVWGAHRLAIFQHPTGDYTTENEVVSILSNGNVGIGTTNPAYLLHLESTADSPSLAIDSLATPTGSSVGGRIDLGFFRGGASKYVLAGDTIGSIWFLGQAIDTYGAGSIKSIVTTGGNLDRSLHVADLAFFTKPSGYNGIVEAMRITGAGNVGIGTAVPDSKLHVSGSNTGLTITNTDNANDTTDTAAIYLTPDTRGGTLGRIIVGKEIADWSVAGNRDSFLAFHTGADGSVSEKVRITSAGNVGIGTTDPGTYKLNIAGTGYLGAAAWVYSSDKRLKENISYIQSGLNVIEQLKPVKFDYIKGEKKQAGFIAQEVKEVLPDIVTEGTDGMLGMKTESIIPYLVKALQEQQRRIEALEAVISSK